MTLNIISGNDSTNTLAGGAGDDLIYGFDPNAAYPSANIAATRVASGLNQPLFATAPPGDTGRLFIVEKTGAIKILDLNTGSVLGTPFLTVSVDSSGERGLLGLAFDPDYATNGFFYIYRTVTTPATHNVVERYQVSANPNVANAASRQTVLNLDNLSGATNHNGGWIGFGPDNDLYIATGDNANGANAQTLSNLLGKILRIDVERRPAVPDPVRQSVCRHARRAAGNLCPGAAQSVAGEFRFSERHVLHCRRRREHDRGSQPRPERRELRLADCRRTELESGLRQSDRVLQSQRRQLDHRRLRLQRRKRRAERAVFLHRFRHSPAVHAALRRHELDQHGAHEPGPDQCRHDQQSLLVRGRRAAAICTSSISTARSIGSRRPSPRRTSAIR